jgi:hypothetical protein
MPLFLFLIQSCNPVGMYRVQVKQSQIGSIATMIDTRLNVGLNELDSQRIYQFPTGPRARARIVQEVKMIIHKGYPSR